MKNNIHEIGIASIGVHIPPLALSVDELAKLRRVDPNKYKIGLGLNCMSLCPEGSSIVDLAIVAAKRALSRWSGDIADIGLIAIGTETAIDHSRPLSAWIAEALNIKGYVRSYEVKHACYGGTLALRQAMEWRLASLEQTKAALIIAADIALYGENDPGEPTQGAGAIAMIIDKPNIASIHVKSFPYSEPVFDFWKPLDEKYPKVDGKFSLDCYIKAAIACFTAYFAERDPLTLLKDFDAICFHTPFPKMVKKAFEAIGKRFSLSEEQINKIFAEKIDSFMEWNRLSGNAYTASLWISVANALAKVPSGKNLMAFSYGSGCGAELLTITKNHSSHPDWELDVKEDVEKRNYLSAEEYQHYRRKV